MKESDKKNIASIILFLCAMGFLYWKIVLEMVHDWYIDENYSHGFLIPVISGYFYWQMRDRVRSVEKSGSASGLFILLAGLTILFIGYLSGEQFTMRFSMLIVLAGAVIFQDCVVPFSVSYIYDSIAIPYL